MEDTIELLRIAWSTPPRARPVERMVDVVVTTLTHPGDGTPARFGLLVSVVHSIVRLDGQEAATRLRQGANGPELAYEGTWIPIYHLRQVLGWGDTQPAEWHGTLRILALRAPEEGPAGPRYTGIIMEEVNEILSTPLQQVQPFPSWILRDVPATAVWGALPGADGHLLLLLDGMALAGRLRAR